MASSSIPTSIEPWLSIRKAVDAIAFYKSAFDASETYRLDVPDGTVIARLSIGGAGYWVADATSASDNQNPEILGGGTIRVILTVSNPDEVFSRAIKAGATEVFPVSEGHGWKLGRLVDPFGLHWEIGHPLTNQ
jgi:PhnB protein